jgi:hypothetical protein
VFNLWNPGTPKPVNRHPEFVRNLVRQLKRLFPEMGSERMARALARAGRCLAARIKLVVAGQPRHRTQLP